MANVESDVRWAVQEIADPTKASDGFDRTFEVSLTRGNDVAVGQVRVPYAETEWLKEKASESSQKNVVREFVERRLHGDNNVQNGWRLTLSRASYSF